MQTTSSMQIIQMSGVATNSLTMLLNPLLVGANGCIINNIDSTNPIFIATDNSGSPSISINAGQFYEFQLSGLKPWMPEALMFYVSGNVTAQPTVVVTA